MLRALFNPNWKEQTLRNLQLRKAVTRFQNRTVYHDITPDILRNIGDDALIQAINDCVEARLPREHVGLVPHAIGLPRGCTSIYYYRMLDYDVWNGGFDQFFDGSDAELAAETMESLRFLELPQIADVVAEAQVRFAAARSTSECDTCYANLHPAVEPHLIRFVREHSDEFVTPRTA